VVLIIINSTKNTVITNTVELANTFLKRLKGLLGRSHLPEKHGILIYPCNQIHSFFMKFPFDAVFLTRDNRVIFFMEDIKPGEIGPLIPKAYSVLELPAGTVRKTKTEYGDILKRQE
jgi:hypothetical protein